MLSSLMYQIKEYLVALVLNVSDDLRWSSHPQVCGNGLLEGGCMTPERLAKHKDEQVIWF